MANPYTSAHTGAEIDDAVNRGKGLTPGTSQANKAAVLGATKNLDVLDIAQDGFGMGGTPITANPSEINKLDGATASTAELNKLAGLTASTAELNRTDGLTAISTELNKADKSEADGVAEASKNVILDANKDLLGKRYDINQSILGLIASGPFMRFEPGLSPRMNAGDVSDLDFADGDFSIALCMSVDGTQDIEIGKGATGDPDAGFEFRFKTDGDIEVHVSDATSLYINTSASPLGQYVAGEVFIVVFVFDTDGNLSQYYNGVLQGTLDISAHEEKTISNTSNFYIDRQSAGGHSQYFQRFYNKALTLAEVRALSSGIPVSYADAGASMTNLITDGGIENWTGDNPDDWADYNAPTVTDEAVIVHGGAHSCKFVANLANEGISSTVFTTVTGRVYRYIVWVYPSGTVVNIGVYKGDGSGWLDNTQYTGLNSGAWNRIVVEVTETAGGAVADIAIHSGAETAMTCYVDDVWGGQIGCTVRYEADAIFFLQWADTGGGEHHGAIVGATPENLPPGHEARYIIQGVSARTVFSGVIPARYRVKSVVAEEKNGVAFPLELIAIDNLRLSADQRMTTVFGEAVLASQLAHLAVEGIHISKKFVKVSSMDVIVRTVGPVEQEMESVFALADWADVVSPTANERSSAQAHSGTYSRKFTVNEVNEGIQSAAFNLDPARDFTLTLWVYPDDSTKVTVRVRKGDNSGWDHNEEFLGLNQDAWNQLSIGPVTPAAAGNNAFVQVDSGTVAAGTFYVDDVIFEQWDGAEVDLTFILESIL